MMIAKEYNCHSVKIAARWGPKPVKIAIFGPKIFNFKILSTFRLINDPKVYPIKTLI